MSSFPLFPSAGANPLVVETQPVFPARKSPGKVAWAASAVDSVAGVISASRLEIRPLPEMVSSGISEIDRLTGGFPRGCLTEVCGSASSGRSSLLLASLAAASQRQEACALVDVTDAFDPLSAAEAGVKFERLLWVRCGKLTLRRHGEEKNNRDRGEGAVEQALRATDLLLQSGGFGQVIIDLGDVPFRTARRIPLTSWFRFQRAVERTPTVLFVVSPAPCAQTCATLLLKLQASGKKSAARHPRLEQSVSPAHAQLLEGLHIEGELLRSRLPRKPARPVRAAFATKTSRILERAEVNL